MLNLKMALLVPSKHSSDALISVEDKSNIEENKNMYFLNFMFQLAVYIKFLLIQ
tara:strand:+ start:284 stop:445 length:162 start_codon:yes stop_codon:yes gene_type:complete